MLSSGFCILAFLVAVTAFHGKFLGHHLTLQSTRGVSSTSSSAITNRVTISSRKLTHLFAEEGSESSGTVVSRCTKKITDSLQPTECIVTSSDSDPNGSHIQIICVATAFEGKNSLQRQRLIYKAIWDEMSGPVHAVDSIIAKTPAEMGN